MKNTNTWTSSLWLVFNLIYIWINKATAWTETYFVLISVSMLLLNLWPNNMSVCAVSFLPAWTCWAHTLSSRSRSCCWVCALCVSVGLGGASSRTPALHSQPADNDGKLSERRRQSKTETERWQWRELTPVEWLQVCASKESCHFHQESLVENTLCAEPIRQKCWNSVYWHPRGVQFTMSLAPQDLCTEKFTNTSL